MYLPFDHFFPADDAIHPAVSFSFDALRHA
jgi:hypothetical protein